MTRLKSIPLAIGAVALAAGTVAAFTALPAAAGPGLQKASDASGKTVPVREAPADVPPAAPAAEPAAALRLSLPTRLLICPTRLRMVPPSRQRPRPRTPRGHEPRR